MVSYNMLTKEWQNHTSIGMLGPKQSLEDGRAIHVPGFGPDALVFVLGGSAKAAAADPKASSQGPLVSFANVSFFDPSSKQWYWQTTTGEAPKGRVGHCLVGSLSQEGSFEMYVHPILSRHFVSLALRLPLTLTRAPSNLASCTEALLSLMIARSTTCTF